MKKTWIALATCGLGAVAVVAFAAAEGEFFSNAGTKAINGTFRRTDRVDSRTLVVSFNTSSNATLTFDAANEIDVTSITFANGLFASGVGDPGGIQIVTNTTTNTDMMYLATPGYGTQQFNFDPPFRLRTGDRIFFAANTANGTSSEWDVTFHGKNPTVTKSDGAAVY